MTETRHDILLASADWQSRTLILAELQERGYEVMAVPGLRYAIQAVLRGLVDPPLLIIDVYRDQEATPDDLKGLLTLLPQRPVILLVGTFDQARWQSLADAVTQVFHRPIRVGDVVETVAQLVEKTDASRGSNR